MITLRATPASRQRDDDSRLSSVFEHCSAASPGTTVNGMSTGRLLRVGVVAMIAPSGVLVGHVLAYLLTVPDPAERAAVLAASGHQWWTLGTVASAVFAAVGIVMLMVAVLRRPPDGGRFRRELIRWLWPRLAASQLGLFVVIETVERAITGHPLSGDLLHEIIGHGASAQIVVALAITGMCWCLTLAVDLACVVITRRPVPTPIAVPSSAHSRVRPLRVRCHLPAARAPPRLTA